MADLIKVTPLAGWSTHTLPQNSLLLDLDVVPTEQAFRTGERAKHRVAMTADQARELAQALLTAAQATEMGQAPNQGRN